MYLDVIDCNPVICRGGGQHAKIRAINVCIPKQNEDEGSPKVTIQPQQLLNKSSKSKR